MLWAFSHPTLMSAFVFAGVALEVKLFASEVCIC